MPGFETVGHASHTSPLPSVSPSAWPGLERSGQLSVALTTPSPSRSFGSTAVQVVVPALTGHTSQASPTVSLSLSAWAPPSSGRTGLNTIGQLSLALSTPSPSLSAAEATPV